MQNVKIPSEIQEIKLDSFSYNNSGTTITPTFVNFFYGSNGSGKSTLAKALKTGFGVTRNQYDDCQTLVFDQEFIDANIRSYGSLPGVFTLDHGNIDVQDKIDELTENRRSLNDKLNDCNEAVQKLTEDKKLAEEKIQGTCWDKCTDIRKAFSTGLTGAGKKSSLYDHIKNSFKTAADYDFEELKKQHASVFSSDDVKYGAFREIEDIDHLDEIASSPILKKAIVNAADTEFASFLKRFSATEWFRSSHKMFHETDGKCPYCQQPLPGDFESMIQNSFDQQYEEDLRSLMGIKALYEDSVTKINLTIAAVPSPVMPGISLDKFNAASAKFQMESMKNIEQLSKKTITPSEKAVLTPLAPILEELQTAILEMNATINTHNSIIDKRKMMQNEWTQTAWNLMAFRCKPELEEFGKEIRRMNAEGRDIQENKLPSLRSQLASIEEEIRNERKKTIETVSAMNAINSLIRNAGIQGIRLIENKSQENTYSLVRSDGNIARNLSEGEKNFIAFLYFYHLVTGSDNSEGRGADAKIVVIDDPVSSMDSSNLYLISSLIRNLVNVCINAADDSLLPGISGTYIKQLFILTHNVYFHKAVTQGYEKYYEPVSFYLIRKENETSRIKLCVKKSSVQAMDTVNDNPVKNDYSLLWNELKVTESGPMMMSCMRRILDYYFIQLCCMDGINLKERLFDDENRKRFITIDTETGKENLDKLNIASALVNQMEASTSVVQDGMYYIDDYSDLDQCREGFRLIFKCMGQEAHYNMMMGNT